MHTCRTRAHSATNRKQTMSTFKTADMYGTTTYEIVKHREDCYSTKSTNYEPHVPLTEAEKLEAEAEAAFYAKWEASYLAEEYPPQEADAMFGYYTTAEAAKRVTELQEALGATMQDLDAFGAPSECAGPATKRLHAELDKLEAEFGTRLRPQTLSEMYAERGLEDRTRPIAELLPSGMLDDTDILAHLGERPAL